LVTYQNINWKLYGSVVHLIYTSYLNVETFFKDIMIIINQTYDDIKSLLHEPLFNYHKIR
jgi:hypothetical protein